MKYLLNYFNLKSKIDKVNRTNIIINELNMSVKKLGLYIFETQHTSYLSYYTLLFIFNHIFFYLISLEIMVVFHFELDMTLL